MLKLEIIKLFYIFKLKLNSEMVSNLSVQKKFVIEIYKLIYLFMFKT